MSQIQRQDNLFSAEDWKVVYRTFNQADFTAYDYDTIRTAMLDYIQVNYPEDFNDYIQSSEFIAIIDLLAFLGQSLAFRTDLNSRENFFDTAERRESILRLAKLINYQPKRNVPARGILKVNKIRTTEPITDSEGTALDNKNVVWNDPNNPDWYDQWLSVINTAFSSTNQFGDPYKSKSISGIETDVYNINSTTNQAVVKNFTQSIDGISTSIDVVKSDIHEDGYLYEKSPDSSESYNLLYRNDNQGFGSTDTGFFVYFKEGELQHQDYQFSTPVPNRNTNVDVTNINDTDVFVQKITSSGTPIEKWTKVPNLFGQNTIYNSLNLNTRNIFNVESRVDDQITVQFSDGNFGNAPYGKFRIWYRQSNGQGQIIRKDRIQNKEISIAYLNKEGQQFTLTLSLSLNYTVSNSQPAETDAEIKTNAPQTFYTQDRMVNAEDYNIFPLTQSNTVRKLKAINKTHIGHSRYIDINDPTGTVKSVNVYGNDGILYKDPDFSLNEEEIEGTVVDNSSYNYIINNILQPLIKKTQLKNFYYDTYKNNILDIHDSTQFEMTNASEKIVWHPFPDSGESDSGYFYLFGGSTDISNSTTIYNNPYSGLEKLGFVRPGTKLEFVDDYTSPTTVVWTTVVSVRNNGSMLSSDTTGCVQLTEQITKGLKVRTVLPSIRTTLSSSERSLIQTKMENGEDFALGYHYYASPDQNSPGVAELSIPSTGSAWYVINEDYLDSTGDFSITNNKIHNNVQSLSSDTSWLIYAEYIPAPSTQASPRYRFTVRGLDYVFESKDEVRFYYVEDYKNIDTATGKAVKDTVTLLDINKDATVLTDPANASVITDPIVFNITDNFTEQDGYVDTKKVKVSNIDSDDDGAPDNPIAHENLIDNNNYIFFNSYESYDGYTYYMLNSDVTQVANTDVANTTSGITFVTADQYFYNSDGNTATVIHEDSGNPIKREGFLNNVTYKAYLGRSFTTSDKLYFQYKHSAPRDQRIDPSVSNIIELIVLQQQYQADITNWFNNNGSRATLPAQPTSDEIRENLLDIEKYKSIGDQIVYTSARFKLLFGDTADSQNQAVFKVVKIPGATYTDNQIKTEVVQAISNYFSISNWDFGDTFYFSELAAYIHTQLSSQISSVVIVPKDAEAKFGDLFQIKSASNELFFSTASVDQVQIVSGLTGVNLRSTTSTVGGS